MTVVTHTFAVSVENPGYRVIRQPSVRELFSAIKWCDLVWQNNLSLRTFWPTLFLRKPVVITHQGSYCRTPAGIDLAHRLKHEIVRRTTSVAISKAVAGVIQYGLSLNPQPLRCPEIWPGFADLRNGLVI